VGCIIGSSSSSGGSDDRLQILLTPLWLPEQQPRHSEYLHGFDACSFSKHVIYVALSCTINSKDGNREYCQTGNLVDSLTNVTIRVTKMTDK
jgi:hypothetical protein